MRKKKSSHEIPDHTVFELFRIFVLSKPFLPKFPGSLIGKYGITVNNCKFVLNINIVMQNLAIFDLMLFEILTLLLAILLPPGTGTGRVAGFNRNNLFSPREKRQYAGNNCPCVSQFTPVNCKCRAINGGAELMCR